MTTTYLPGTPSWVDLGTTDIAGAAAFYGSLFGWVHQDFGPEMGNYGMFLKDGKRVAGIGPASDPTRGTSWATYFATDDTTAVASAVEANGGKVIAAALDVTDQGRMAVFTDSNGAYFSVWQPGAHKGADLANEPGSFTWNELISDNIAAAKSFYPAVLGVGIRDVDMGGGLAYTLFEVAGRAIAGAMPHVPHGLPQEWNVYFAVADCYASHTQASELGAATVTEPTDSPAGTFAIMKDPQGGHFCMIRNNPDFQA